MRAAFLIALLILCSKTKAGQMERQLRFDCRGLEGYDIQATYDIDWGWGKIREKNSTVVIGFVLGPMVEVLVPAERPAGFRTFKVERVGKAVLRHGYYVYQKQYFATLLGAPIESTISLNTKPENSQKLLAVARVLATAPCKVTRIQPPSN
jgi:hypothetical protein